MPLEEWLDNCPIDFKPIIYQRYGDYIFVLFSSKEHLQLFGDCINKQHKCIKFTSETDHEKTLKLPATTNNLKHRFLENELLVM